MSNKKLAVQLNCPCNPGFKYKNYHTFLKHKKSNRHELWQKQHDIIDLRIRLGKLEKEIIHLKANLHKNEEINDNLRKLNNLLIIKIKKIKLKIK